MPTTGPTGTLALANSPTITNLPMATANTEYSWTIPANTRRFTLQSRNPGQIQLAFAANKSNTEFMTLRPGAVLNETDLDLNASVLYLRCSTPNQIIEILSWQRL